MFGDENQPRARYLASCTRKSQKTRTNNGCSIEFLWDDDEKVGWVGDVLKCELAGLITHRWEDMSRMDDRKESR